MKKSINKLSLNKLTISNLDATTMDQMLGGGAINGLPSASKTKITFVFPCTPPPPQTKVCI